MVGVIKQDEQSAAGMHEVVINFEKVRRQATISSLPSDDSRNYIEIDRNGSLIYLSGDDSDSPSPQYRNGGRRPRALRRNMRGQSSSSIEGAD